MRVSGKVAVVSCALFLLAGCSGVSLLNNSTVSKTVAGAALQGKVHGGQNPISGAHVYLYAVNNTGYGSASVSLLTSSVLSQTPPGGEDGAGNYYVTTASDGTFTITGEYNCFSATPHTYLYAVGGNSGSGQNPAIGLIAGAGDCTHTGFKSKFIMVNEVSTIAAVYAVAGYVVDPTHVSSANNTLSLTGIELAGDTADNLYTGSTGVALATTPAANGTVPQSEINTLADILAACVNSTGPPYTACTTLFSNAKKGSTAPTDTATAAINIAHNPGANIASLFALQAGSGAPFVPDLSAAPNDFTLAISFTGNGLNGPDGLAIDASGTVWVANSGGDSVSAFSQVGSAISGSPFSGGGLNGPVGVAIDGSGYIWVANRNNSITKLNSSGGAVSGSPFSGGGLNQIADIVVDSSGNVWTTNVGASGPGANSISKFSSSGGAVSGSSGYTGSGQLIGPSGLAIDISGNVWVGNNPEQLAGSSISEFNSSGTAISGSPFSGGGLDQPEGIAFDATGNLWAVNYLDPGNISEFDFSGTANPSSPFSGGGLNYPVALAFDGAGNLWVSNNSGNSISEFNSSGTAISGSNGYKGGGLSNPIGLVIDGSGNLWVSNPGPDGSPVNSLVEFVGAASPVVTPVVANLISPYGGHAVNKP